MNLTETTRRIVVAMAVTFAAGLLFVNVYNSLVDAPNWGSNLPQSIEATRAYFKTTNPGSFFRIASPLNQVIAVLAIILCWKVDRRVRNLLIAGLALSLLSDAFTFAYFYPRNALMFEAPITSLDAVRQAQAEWASMNWVRSGGVLLNLIVNLSALFSLAVVQPATKPQVAGPKTLEAAPV